ANKQFVCLTHISFLINENYALLLSIDYDELLSCFGGTTFGIGGGFLAGCNPLSVFGVGLGAGGVGLLS
ncbi:hypothetical protein QTO08_24500, partial [Vibrio parahaemolyticus]